MWESWGEALPVSQIIWLRGVEFVVRTTTWCSLQQDQMNQMNLMSDLKRSSLRFYEVWLEMDRLVRIFCGSQRGLSRSISEEVECMREQWESTSRWVGWTPVSGRRVTRNLSQLLWQLSLWTQSDRKTGFLQETWRNSVSSSLHSQRCCFIFSFIQSISHGSVLYSLVKKKSCSVYLKKWLHFLSEYNMLP